MGFVHKPIKARKGAEFEGRVIRRYTPCKNFVSFREVLKIYIHSLNIIVKFVKYIYNIIVIYFNIYLLSIIL